MAGTFHPLRDAACGFESHLSLFALGSLAQDGDKRQADIAPAKIRLPAIVFHAACSAHILLISMQKDNSHERAARLKLESPFQFSCRRSTTNDLPRRGKAARAAGGAPSFPHSSVGDVVAKRANVG